MYKTSSKNKQRHLSRITNKTIIDSDKEKQKASFKKECEIKNQKIVIGPFGPHYAKLLDENGKYVQFISERDL